MAARTDGLRQQLRAFAQDHQKGWNHAEWSHLVHELAQEGHDVGDLDALGIALEQERVKAVLTDLGVSGLGPKRKEVLSARYPRMWELERATVEELAALPSVPRSLAVNLHKALHA